jgi:2-C-methyl-D-erythritol 4-phosphate cytidylyltransferase/2-C-methyl-D-erythritol 2,4-cyclodiphosphate synthase
LPQPLFVSAIIAAGGRGRRFGGTVPKQLLAVDGRSPLERSVALLVEHPAIDEVIVALPDEFVAEPPPYLTGRAKSVRVVAGGPRRQDSVANAFEATDPSAAVVLIHDAARPFASPDLIARTIAAAAESGAALAALRSSDTVKQSAGSEPSGPHFVAATIPRERVYLAQTPQAFRRHVLREALSLSEAGSDATDEASLAERAGYPVRLVDGESTNIKITHAADLSIADALARAQAVPPPVTRAGTGYDLHRLVPGRPLVIGGLTIAFELGALGHSDADVACHAVTDAILGAAGLGDIGRMFPDSDPQWKDASSLKLLSGAVARTRAHGYDVVNVDITVVLERPKIRGYVDAMRAAVANAIGIELDRVSIKGKTNEGVDAVGRGEAVAAHAVALVRSRP